MIARPVLLWGDVNVLATHLHLTDTDTLCGIHMRHIRQCFDEQLLLLGAFCIEHCSECATAVLTEGNKDDQSTPNDTED